jgi:hypothetical protein
MEVDTGAAISVMNEDTYTLSKKKHPNLARAEGIKGKTKYLYGLKCWVRWRLR